MDVFYSQPHVFASVSQAMIPVKDTRELLYKLLKAEYVQIQEVARTSDHAPSRTFYLWRVDLLRVVEQVGRELYRATSNLRARLIHELSQEQEVRRKKNVSQLFRLFFTFRGVSHV